MNKNLPFPPFKRFNKTSSKTRFNPKADIQRFPAFIDLNKNILINKLIEEYKHA